MSEEILKALTELFAIIAKQDGVVTEKERDFVVNFFKQQLDQASIPEYMNLFDMYTGMNGGNGETATVTLQKTSVRDTVQTLAICKQVNRTLTQKQKIFVLIKLLELVASDHNLTHHRMQFIDTASAIFNVPDEEREIIESFVLLQHHEKLDYPEILFASREKPLPNGKMRHIPTQIDGKLLFLRVKSIDMYYMKFLGEEEVKLNGFKINPEQIYLFPHGSTLKEKSGTALYYSDIIANFLSNFKSSELSYQMKHVEYRFPDGELGLREVNLSESAGRLIGIMGSSGSGKTTLISVMAGLKTPSRGKILINGYNINDDADQLKGVVGYVSQDDLLIEDLTVFENLYYNAKLCMANLTNEEIGEKVLKLLKTLGLDYIKDLKVGSVLNKMISGGQRKRLNIALELIREPSVLFVDEPTSGLSSRDSENVIDLLKELSFKGKLIFAVIHQPSSEIYKMFDKVMIMDIGGYTAFYGNPIDAITYFKSETHQVDREKALCEVCGNVNPEQIFTIIEDKVVNEYGQFTPRRKVTPVQWSQKFRSTYEIPKESPSRRALPISLYVPGWLQQVGIFITRDFKSKIQDKQYLLINFLEAPLLAIILAFIIRYQNADGGDTYLFRFNDNIPAFILMSIIVALFLGLSVSAEEIIRDKKILKRESFLNLSWSSYLSSKLLLLFGLSAIQTLTFVVVGNLILEIHGMMWTYWLVLFSCACFCNVLGLNISSAFKSAVTVYIVIPIILIPQMILSGLLFKFDQLNDSISSKDNVPLVADIMASRWAFEAIAVQQYTNNRFEQPFYDYEATARQADFKIAFWVKELEKRLIYVVTNIRKEDPETAETVQADIRMLVREFAQDPFQGSLDTAFYEAIAANEITPVVLAKMSSHLTALNDHYQKEYQQAINKKDNLYYTLEKKDSLDLNMYKDLYFNESLSDLVRNVNTNARIVEYNDKLIQQVDPIYRLPATERGFLDYRAHFFAPKKYIFNKFFDTYYFNVIVIWLMTAIFYISIYYKLPVKSLKFLSRFKLIRRNNR